LFPAQFEQCSSDGERLAGTDVLIGRFVGGCRIEALIGSGTGGSVFRAFDVARRREVALKIVHAAALSAHSGLARFTREAEAIRMIQHPSVMTVFDYGRDGNLHYIAMELLSGRTLDQVLALDGAMAPSRVVAIAGCMAEALATVHGMGIVHRDLKPANVMLCSVEGRETVKLLDFGIVHFVDDEQRLTRANAVVGTPLYMAPEQVMRGTIGPTADLYALGAMMFEMLSGSTPFKGAVEEVLGKQVYEAPPVLAELHGLGGLVASMLAKSPEERPQSAGEVVATLAEIGSGVDGGTMIFPRDLERTVRALAPRVEPTLLDHEPSLSRSHRLAVGLGLLCAVLVLIGLGWAGRSQGGAEHDAVVIHVAAISTPSVPHPAPVITTSAIEKPIPTESPLRREEPAVPRSSAPAIARKRRDPEVARQPRQAPKALHIPDRQDVKRAREELKVDLERLEKRRGRSASDPLYREYLDLIDADRVDLPASEYGPLLERFQALRARVATAGAK
jgi:serine/threonine-protein kinase